MRGWNLKNLGEQKAIKRKLYKRVEEIDAIAEHCLLSMEEWEERIELENKLENIIRDEDLQWKQKAGQS